MMAALLSFAFFALLLCHECLAQLMEEICEGHADFGPKIVNGTNARPFDTAWMASLYNISHNTNEFICGGSLIHKRFVLTAAHCSLRQEKLLVRMGESDRSCPAWKCRGLKEYDVIEAIPHPQFNISGRFENDIGLLKLQTEVTFNDHIRPICFILDEAVHAERIQRFRAFGWGATLQNVQSSKLQTIKLTRKNSKNCLKNYNIPDANDQQICAGNDFGDTCIGDSGGPLASDFIYRGKTSFVLFGIVSYGGRFCNLNAAVYTNAMSYKDWVADNVAPYDIRIAEIVNSRN
ncbi:CLIP domain-containing serine protease B15-like [Drosophila elegans]|uniref:CLIP domain-containing serine protease B15-like n=1 Tax=Drosophila elegans TaxID=30023 RepID=UPI001BC867AC|nr:CLIP domain-containing serine protease B15-like [Drosophila elegans]